MSTDLEYQPAAQPPDVEAAIPVTAVAEAAERVVVFGLSLVRWNHVQTLDAIEALIARSEPAFFITANLHYARLSSRDLRLAAVNRQAAFLVADGMPLVWYSRRLGRPLPERIAGADLIHSISDRAARRGYRLFLLGGAPGVAEEAAERLTERHPGLRIAGIEAPMMEELSPLEHESLLARIRQSAADVLLVAFGQPKGELWLAEHGARLGVPVGVQVGASFDFVAGRIRRAPRWMQVIGAEWVFRALREPKRLLPRYLDDLAFLLRVAGGDVAARAGRHHPAADEGLD